MHPDSGDRPAKGKPRQQTPGGAASPLDAVRQLLSEKAQFEKWLRDLEAKQGTTPAHVFARVRADYSGRLQGVLDRLQTHAASMQEHAATLSRKLDQLTETEQGILDTRAESELRAEVGELSAQDWEKISKKVERDIAKIKQDQALILSDLNDLRAILAETSGRAPAPQGAAASPRVGDADERAAPAGDAQPAAPAAANVDELAFLKSVIGTAPTDGAGARASEPKPVADATPAPSQKPAEKAAGKPAGKPAEKLVETPASGPTLRSKGGEEPLAMHVTGSNPIVLRSSGVVEQPKTLKCAECSAMNYPTEWYCERCGAELTSV